MNYSGRKINISIILSIVCLFNDLAFFAQLIFLWNSIGKIKVSRYPISTSTSYFIPLWCKPSYRIFWNQSKDISRCTHVVWVWAYSSKRNDAANEVNYSAIRISTNSTVPGKIEYSRTSRFAARPTPSKLLVKVCWYQ